MSKKHLIITILIVGFSILGLYFIVQSYLPHEATKLEQKSDLEYNPQKDKLLELNYKCEVGRSVFDILQKRAKIEYESSTFGNLVTSINDSTQGDGKYWLYFVDSKEATISADSYICQGEENIKWELK